MRCIAVFDEADNSVESGKRGFVGRKSGLRAARDAVIISSSLVGGRGN
jgi:hypothetical protein